MNKKKRLSITLIAFTLLFLLVGCQTNKSTVKAPSVPMKTVTQNSKGDLVTFEFQLPEGWISSPQYNFTVVGCPEDTIKKKFKTQEDALPFAIGISNYYYSGLALSEKDKQMYKDLFAGKTSAYEDHMKQSFANAADMLNSESPSKVNVPEIDYKYQHYDGANGKITAVNLRSRLK